MTNYFKVESPLKHNGTLYERGAVIEGEAGAFDDLVKQGVVTPTEQVQVQEEKQPAPEAQKPEVKPEEKQEQKATEPVPLKAYEPPEKLVEDLGASL